MNRYSKTVCGTLMVTGIIAMAFDAAQAADNAASCNRECLITAANNYMVALVKHDATGLPLAPGLKIVENAKLTPVGQGMWQLAKGIREQRQYVTDPSTGQVGVMAIFDGVNDQLGTLALRLKIDQGQITEVDTLSAQDGEGGPGWLPEEFLYRESPYVREVPAAHRNSRDELLRVVNKYWDMATTSHKGYEMDYADDCFHFENGMSTLWESELFPAMIAQQKTNAEANGFVPSASDGRIWTCAREMILTSRAWTAARDRRFIVDEDRGLVMSFTLVDVNGPGLIGQTMGEQKRTATSQPSSNAPGPQAGAPGEGPPAGGAGTPLRPMQIGTMVSSQRQMAPGPPGLSAKGLQAARSQRTHYNVQVNWIVGGKIKREQSFVRVLPPKADWPK